MRSAPALGGGYVNYFSIAGRSYKVIPQVLQTDRLNPSQVLDFYIKTPTGGMIPASTVASIKYSVVPESINRFQQLNSVTISRRFRLVAGRGAAIPARYGERSRAHRLYGRLFRQSRQFMQESGGFLVTLLFAIIIVFLALAAQFESFRDPIVILVSVPMALFGAMIFIFLGFASINIYTEVGLVTLMGLISKHGILIVEVANHQQRGRQEQARSDRGGRRHPSAADPDDHRCDGVRRGAAGDRLGRRRGRPPRDGPGDFHRPVDRHAVHAVRRAGDVYALASEHKAEPVAVESPNGPALEM